MKNSPTVINRNPVNYNKNSEQELSNTFRNNMERLYVYQDSRGVHCNVFIQRNKPCFAVVQVSLLEVLR